MTKAKPVLIGGVQFVSKNAATQHARAILNRHPLLAIVGGADAAFLHALIQHHPERDEKLGGLAVERFEVHPFGHGSRCFFLVRSDGSRVDFSYKRCIEAAGVLEA